jgi:hypothetical protein
MMMMTITVMQLIVELGRRKERIKRRRRSHTRIVLIETTARAATKVGIMIAIGRAAVDVTTRIRTSLQIVAKKRDMINPEGMKPPEKKERR